MNMIYTVEVTMARKVKFMGGRLMTANVTGSKTLHFATVEEANRFTAMLEQEGYEYQMGLIKATAEDAMQAVKKYHQNLGSSFEMKPIREVA